MGTYSGQFDRRITFMSPSKAQGDSGEMTTSYTAAVTDVPASIKPTGGNESFESEQRVANDTIVFTIRYPRSYTPLKTWQVVYEGKTGNILSADENTLRGRRVEMLVTVQFKDNS